MFNISSEEKDKISSAIDSAKQNNFRISWSSIVEKAFMIVVSIVSIDIDSPPKDKNIIESEEDVQCFKIVNVHELDKRFFQQHDQLLLKLLQSLIVVTHPQLNHYSKKMRAFPVKGHITKQLCNKETPGMTA